MRLDQQQSTQSLRDKLKIDHIDDVLRWNRLRLFGHRQRQDDSLWSKKIIDFEVGLKNDTSELPPSEKVSKSFTKRKNTKLTFPNSVL